jgi:diguanylate cyclase (GGDEF)-like protein
VLAVVMVATTWMLGTGHLESRRDAVARGAWEATTFAQNAHSTVHSLTTIGAAVPRARWRQAVGPLLADRDQAARGQLILLRALAGEDPRLDALDRELTSIARDVRTARTDAGAERRVLARAVRLGRIAGSLARDLRAREKTFSRRIIAWQAILLVVALGLLLWLFRAFQRVLIREATAHATHLRHLADHDPLTGLGNRRKLERDLAEASATATLARPVQVLVCDLDGFKAYNDECGHAAGDALLSRVAARIAGVAGPSGAAYRLGGDEFCVLWRGDEDVRPTLVRAIAQDADDAAVTGSVGVAVLPRETTDGDAALRLADGRMYAAKATSGAGRAALVFRAA